MNMKRTMLLHVLLGVPAALCLVVALILLVFKLGEFGAGATMSWAPVIGLGVGGILLVVADAFVLLKGLE